MFGRVPNFPLLNQRGSNMKKYLLLLTLIGMAACGPVYVSPDPCSPSYFNEVLCAQAVAANGYYYQGAFVSMTYSQPYTYYSQNYSTYRSRGGRIQTVSPDYYSRSYRGSAASTRTPTYSVPRTNGSAYTPSTPPTYTVPRTGGSRYSPPTTTQAPRPPIYSVPRSTSTSRPYSVPRSRRP
jgi:hypothetical protein